MSVSYVKLHKVQLPKKYKNNFSVDLLTLLKKLYTVENDYVRYKKDYQDSPWVITQLKNEYFQEIDQKLSSKTPSDLVKNFWSKVDKFLFIGEYGIGKIYIRDFLDILNKYINELKNGLEEISTMSSYRLPCGKYGVSSGSRLYLVTEEVLSDSKLISETVITSLLFFQNYLINSQFEVSNALKEKELFRCLYGTSDLSNPDINLCRDMSWKEVGKSQFVASLTYLNSVEVALVKSQNRYFLEFTLDSESRISYHFDILFFFESVPDLTERTELATSFLIGFKILTEKKCIYKNEVLSIYNTLDDLLANFVDFKQRNEIRPL